MTPQVITRAIFVLTSPEAGQQFLRVLPDLRGIGLSDAIVLHLLPAKPGPAEPMPELANWVRHFEAAIPNVELALKRGDPVKWVYELARVRDVDIVVISGTPNGDEWDLESVSSPLRTLGIPILYLPDHQFDGSLGDTVLVAIKAPEAWARVAPRLEQWFGANQLRAVRVVEPGVNVDAVECSGVTLETVPEEGDVATTLLIQAQACDATLVTVLADEDGKDSDDGMPVVQPLVESTERPLLIWSTSTSDVE
jgi:hypothetical protein